VSAASNTRECILEHRGKRIKGALFSQLPFGRADLASGTTTLVFDDGTGFTFASNGSFWSETKRDVSRAIERFQRQLEETGLLAKQARDMAGRRA
jgi:hypothetical protein